MPPRDHTSGGPPKPEPVIPLRARTRQMIADLAATAGLSVSRVWMDPAKQFSVQLLEPRVLSG